MHIRQQGVRETALFAELRTARACVPAPRAGQLPACSRSRVCAAFEGFRKPALWPLRVETHTIINASITPHLPKPCPMY